MTPKNLSDKAKSIEAELISELIIDPGKLNEVRTILSTEDFIHYPAAYSIVLDSFLHGKNIIVELKTANLPISHFLAPPSYRRISEVCNDIKETTSACRLLEVLTVSTKSIPTTGLVEFSTDLQRKIIDSVKISHTEKPDIARDIREYREKQKFYKEKFLAGGGLIGLSTGYDKLDTVIDGIRPEHLWIIGGYTNVGKTFASLNIAAHLIKQGKRVVYFSYEMNKTDIISRLIGILTQINGNTVLKGFPHDEKKVDQALDLLEHSNLSIHTSMYPISELEFLIFEEINKSPVDAIMIDYLQQVRVQGARTEYEHVTAAVNRLQDTAKRLKVPIVALSQVSNDSARNPNDQVMGFKGSGGIAAAADLAIEITIGEEDKQAMQEKMNSGLPILMKWNIRKNRHGPKGFIEMTFDGKTGTFTPYTRAKENF